MSARLTREDLKHLSRFYGYVRPHWKLLVTTIVMLLVSGAMTVNVFVLGKFAFGSLGKAQDASETAAPSDAAPGADVEGPLERLDEAKQHARDWFLGLAPVSAVTGWFARGNRFVKIALLLALVIGPLTFGAAVGYEYFSRRLVWRVMADIRVGVFRQVSRMSLRYFARQRTGELLSRLTNDVFATQEALRLIVGRFLQHPVRLVICLGIAFAFSWQLTLIGLVSAPIVILLQARFSSRIRRQSKKNLERLADITDSLTQTLQGIRVVKAFDAEAAENEEYRRRMNEQLSRAFKLVRTRAVAGAVPEILLVWSLAFVLVVAGRLVATGGLEVDELLLCLLALAATSGPARRIVYAYNDLQGTLPGLTRVFELLDREPEIRDHPNAVEIDGVREGVSFRDVWFAYDSRPVLKGVSLQVPCGKTFAIVGETGAGKSTMLDLVPRFYDVARGCVEVDGVDVRKVKHASLMRQIAIVSQHPFLFNRTVAENIRYGRRGATDEEVVAAARAANIHDFIEGLPEGYETHVGEGGGRLSGGQRQCVTIARALLKDAPILILDEATSSLDAESEMLVQTALNNLMRGRTTFVIAHRLSTVRHADRIVVLKDGRIAEQGTHAELLALGGEYERLYRLQFFEHPADDQREENAAEHQPV
jgi:subfamily B ATP-binding cassette protein MsbA